MQNIKGQSKGYYKRRKIFEKFSKNLYSVFNHYGYNFATNIDDKAQIVTCPLYICPLCLRSPFTLKSIEEPDPILTLEDIPPKSLGGTSRILTCKKCNNTFGHTLDNSVKEWLLAERFSKESPFSIIKKVQYKFDDKRIKGELHFNQNKELKFLIDEESNPYHFKDIFQFIERKDANLKFTFTTPSKKSYLKGMLRLAYLQSFAYFGYSFIFENNLKRIRRFFIEKENSNIPIYILEKNFDDDLVGLNLITSPESLSNYLIILPLNVENKRINKGILIPKPGIAGWNSYMNFKEVNSKSITLTHKENYQGVKETNDARFDYFNLFGNQ
jgi:hypothetical protein